VKTLLKLLFAVSVLAMISGCARLEASQAPEPIASETEPAPNSEPVACKGSIQGEIENTVNSQTSAFADNNFELAYSFASPSFRSNVSLEGFVQIIASSYGLRYLMVQTSDGWRVEGAGDLEVVGEGT